MEMNKKSATPKKNCAYSLQDSIVFVDSSSWGMQWVGPLPRNDAPLQLMGCLIVGVRRDYMAVACAYLPHDAVVIFVVGVVFFRRSRLFFREATFFSQR